MGIMSIRRTVQYTAVGAGIIVIEVAVVPRGRCDQTTSGSSADQQGGKRREGSTTRRREERVINQADGPTTFLFRWWRDNNMNESSIVRWSCFTGGYIQHDSMYAEHSACSKHVLLLLLLCCVVLALPEGVPHWRGGAKATRIAERKLITTRIDRCWCKWEWEEVYQVYRQVQVLSCIMHKASSAVYSSSSHSPSETKHTTNTNRIKKSNNSERQHCCSRRTIKQKAKTLRKTLSIYICYELRWYCCFSLVFFRERW